MVFFVELWIIVEIYINYGIFDKLCSVFVVNDIEIWICGDSNVMKFYNF